MRWLTHLALAVRLVPVALLAIWMGLFAPLLCQYHGLMWHTDAANASEGVATPQQVAGYTAAVDDHATHAHHHSHHQDDSVQASRPTALSDGGLLHHRAPLNPRMVQSSFVALHCIAHYTLDPVRALERLSSERERLPRQRPVAPPERPPRLEIQSHQAT